MPRVLKPQIQQPSAMQIEKPVAPMS